jgi:hypothetical protein
LPHKASARPSPGVSVKTWHIFTVGHKKYRQYQGKQNLTVGSVYFYSIEISHSYKISAFIRLDYTHDTFAREVASPQGAEVRVVCKLDGIKRIFDLRKQ